MQLERLTQEDRIKRAFQDGSIKRISVNLHHEYSPKRLNNDRTFVPLDEVYNLVDEAVEKILPWYQDRVGEPFNKTRPPKTEVAGEFRTKLYGQPGFRKATDILFGGGSFNELNDLNALPKTPWYNEIMTGEEKYENVFGSKYDDSLHTRTEYTNVDLVQLHSLELQLNREGFIIPVKPVSTDGIIITSPDDKSEKGYIVFGVRGGGSYPNTYHTVGAGGLSVSDALKERKESIEEAFVRGELIPELGERLNGVSSVRSIGRTEDWLLGTGNITYVFQVNTELSKEQVTKSWVTAKDAKEHRELVFIPNNSNGVERFLRENFRGVVENRINRTDNERVLLNPGALDLAVYAGIEPAQLRGYYRGGVW